MERGAVYLVSTHGYFEVDPVTGSVATAGRPDTGGQTVYVVELAKALGRAGRPTFVVTRWFDIVKPELQEIGPNAWILRLKAGDLAFVPKERIYSVLSQLVDNLINFIQRDWVEMFVESGLTPPPSVQPMLFHGHYVDGGIVAQQASRTFQVPFFWTSHSLGALKRERMGGDPDKAEAKFNFHHRINEETRLIQKALKHGGLTVTANTEVADIQRLYGLDLGQQAKFIPPGVNTSLFCPRPGQADPPNVHLPHTGPLVLMGGRIARTKGLELGLAAFQQALATFPEANLAIFGGSESPSEEERDVMGRLHEYREHRGIARKVFFLGGLSQDELPAIYRRANVFLLPSRHEPFGMVALEAAACGVPLVVSSHAGIAGELEHGKHAMVAHPEDAPEFTAAILELLGNPERAQAMAAEALEHINGHYSWEGIMRKHVAFWKRKGVAL